MATIDDVRQRAVLLTEDSVGVTTEQRKRKIQANGDSFYTHISPSWLDQLNIATQSAETMHSLSLGVKPVIIQQPAVIVQPAELLIETSNGHRPSSHAGARKW